MTLKLAAITETKYIKRCLEQTAQYFGAACHESQNTKGSVFLKFHLPIKKKHQQQQQQQQQQGKLEKGVTARCNERQGCRRKFPKTNRRRECVHLREAFYARRHRNS